MKRRKRRKKKHYHTGIHVSVKSIIPCNYRSGWELLYMQWLDENVDVVSYQYEPFFIEYVSNLRSGKKRKYIPDFLVEYADGHKELVEIKPSKRLTQVRVKKKLDAAKTWSRAHGVILSVLSEHDLRSLGLL